MGQKYIKTLLVFSHFVSHCLLNLKLLLKLAFHNLSAVPPGGTGKDCGTFFPHIFLGFMSWLFDAEDPGCSFG